MFLWDNEEQVTNVKSSTFLYNVYNLKKKWWFCSTQQTMQVTAQVFIFYLYATFPTPRQRKYSKHKRKQKFHGSIWYFAIICYALLPSKDRDSLSLTMCYKAGHLVTLPTTPYCHSCRSGVKLHKLNASQQTRPGQVKLSEHIFGRSCSNPAGRRSGVSPVCIKHAWHL